jgi:hypothetical protein
MNQRRRKCDQLPNPLPLLDHHGGTKLFGTEELAVEEFLITAELFVEVVLVEFDEFTNRACSSRPVNGESKVETDSGPNGVDVVI